MRKMNWISKLFRRNKPLTALNGAVVYLDTDMIPKEQIQRIKLRMTPVFVEYSGTKVRRCGMNMREAVKQSA